MAFCRFVKRSPIALSNSTLSASTASNSCSTTEACSPVIMPILSFAARGTHEASQPQNMGGGGKAKDKGRVTISDSPEGVGETVLLDLSVDVAGYPQLGLNHRKLSHAVHEPLCETLQVCHLAKNQGSEQDAAIQHMATRRFSATWFLSSSIFIFCSSYAGSLNSSGSFPTEFERPCAVSCQAHSGEARDRGWIGTRSAGGIRLGDLEHLEEALFLLGRLSGGFGRDCGLGGLQRFVVGLEEDLEVLTLTESRMCCHPLQELLESPPAQLDKRRLEISRYRLEEPGGHRVSSPYSSAMWTVSRPGRGRGDLFG